MLEILLVKVKSDLSGDGAVGNSCLAYFSILWPTFEYPGIMYCLKWVTLYSDSSPALRPTRELPSEGVATKE